MYTEIFIFGNLIKPCVSSLVNRPFSKFQQTKLIQKVRSANNLFSNYPIDTYIRLLSHIIANNLIYIYIRLLSHIVSLIFI